MVNVISTEGDTLYVIFISYNHPAHAKFESKYITIQNEMHFVLKGKHLYPTSQKAFKQTLHFY